jgi:glycerol-3-phosphate acyltransferase PlsY
LGSVPWGYLLGRLAGKDIRLEGSKNIGATNLWRVCGWKYGLLCFVLDFAKGLAAVLLLGRMEGTGIPQPYPAIAAAFCAILGHNFPVWLRFRGGKGVATSAGAVAGLMPLPFLAAIAVFIVSVAVFRYISLGSMLASAALVAACCLLLPEPLGANLPFLVMACLLCAMIILRHRANIQRILAGTENRFPPPKK